MSFSSLKIQTTTDNPIGVEKEVMSFSSLKIQTTTSHDCIGANLPMSFSSLKIQTTTDTASRPCSLSNVFLLS